MVLLFDELSLHIVMHILPHIHIWCQPFGNQRHCTIFTFNNYKRKSPINRRILAIIEHF